MLVALFFLIAILAMPTVLTSDSDNSPGSDIVEVSRSLAWEWLKKANTPEAGGYGEAVVGTGEHIYIARCMRNPSAPYFWRYDPSTDIWNESMNVSGLSKGAFRSGTSLTWDNGSYIYALLGGRYSDTNRRLFYRYSIQNDSWEQLNDTPFAQGVGDALTWSGYDNRLYAFLGSEKLGTVFARYDISNSSWNTTLPFNWTSTDDGASLVAGGEYLYALRGDWQKTTPNVGFARYCIPNGTWEDLSPMPENEGVWDGASLLLTEKYPDYIYAIGGGSCLEGPGYNFYRYNVTSNEWQQLKSIPCSVGYYAGNRLGVVNGHIYYWQGAPATWDCDGNAFFLFDLVTQESTPIIVEEKKIGEAIVSSP